MKIGKGLGENRNIITLEEVFYRTKNENTNEVNLNQHILLYVTCFGTWKSIIRRKNKIKQNEGQFHIKGVILA